MTIGCIWGLLDIDPPIEYWLASKITTIRNDTGGSVVNNGDSIDTWRSTNGKRRIDRFQRTAESYLYSSNTAWPAVTLVSAQPQKTRMTLSNFLFENGETMFMVFRIVTNGLHYGFRKYEATTTVSNPTINGEQRFTSNGNGAVIGGVIRTNATGLFQGDLNTVIVYGFRIFQNGTNVTIWAIGHTGVVVVLNVANVTWVSNRNAFQDIYANGATINCYHVEINRNIRATADMLTRRNELAALYA